MEMQPPVPSSTTRVMRKVKLNGFSLTQVNGTKVHGPSEDWIGPPPSSSCELFIYGIPKNTNEYRLLELCMQFGRVYYFRVPINVGVNGIRGFAFVRYTNEQDAECAMTVLNHCFVAPKKLLNVVNSCEKCSLFVRNIPKHLNEEEIEKGLRTVYPNMSRIYSNSPNSNLGNRQSVFVVFATHQEALEAKKRSSPGILRLWNEYIEVVWAITDGAKNSTFFNKTLFFLNANLCLRNNELYNLIGQYVDRTTIYKMSVAQANTFVEFTCRQSAETVLHQMNGVRIGDSRLMVKWAQRSVRQRILDERNKDFDALLRLKCIANSWKKPITVFGSFFETEEIQYGAVLLRNDKCDFRLIIVSLQCSELVDIHSRLCEVVVTLIDTNGIFPDCNYVFCAEKDVAHLLGVMVFEPQLTFIASHRVPDRFAIDLMEVIDISRSCALLSKFPEEHLLEIYQKSCMVNEIHPYPNDWKFKHRLIGAIMPNYRKKPPLRHNLDNTQIVLALCYLRNGRNFSVEANKQYAASSFDRNQILLPYVKMPLSISQCNLATHRSGSHCSAVLLSICPLHQAIIPRHIPKKMSKAGVAIPVNQMIISDTYIEGVTS